MIFKILIVILVTVFILVILKISGLFDKLYERTNDLGNICVDILDNYLNKSDFDNKDVEKSTELKDVYNQVAIAKQHHSSEIGCLNSCATSCLGLCTNQTAFSALNEIKQASIEGTISIDDMRNKNESYICKE